MEKVNIKKIGFPLLVILVAVSSFQFGSRTGGKAGSKAELSEKDAVHDHGKETSWTCSMHPQIKLNKQGKCPICFMDLIPLETDALGDEDDNPRQLTLSESARRLAGIMTVPAIRRNALSEIRMSGKIVIDERRVESISSRVKGRIDRLFVDYTGMEVKKGDHLALIYSPELVLLQQELLGAARAVESLSPDASELVKSNARGTLEAAKEKLRLLGFSEDELNAVLTRGVASDHMTIRATQSGVVIEKMATTGSYVETGMPIFSIADLRKLWIELDAYESDLVWLRVGQRAQFTVEAFPGETFSGTVSFIDPMVDPMVRTVKVRVVTDNSSGKLKPEMLVRAVSKAQISASGKVYNASLKGKWISPMHPEIVKDGPGTCDICGMPLVPAESLGYVTSGNGKLSPLLIPATAPLFTGERAIIYVETSSNEKGTTYEGREVVLGPRAGDYYVVKSGISEGEKVVVNGAFRIDSELQIRAKPSMMNPVGGSGAVMHAGHAGVEKKDGKEMVDAASVPVSPEFRTGLDAIYKAYFRVSSALVKDDLDEARKGFAEIRKAISNVKSVKGKVYSSWNVSSKTLLADLSHVVKIADLSEARVVFEKVSTQIIALEKHYRHQGGQRYVAFCPMALSNKGAYWLQETEVINNPYFGETMLRCGEIKERISGY